MSVRRIAVTTTNWGHLSKESYLFPRRVLAQTAKTRGGPLEAPTYREESFAVAREISIFENTARKGLLKVHWGSNKGAKDSGSGVCHDVLKKIWLSRRKYLLVEKKAEMCI